MACALAEYFIEERAFPDAKRKVLLACFTVLLACFTVLHCSLVEHCDSSLLKTLKRLQGQAMAYAGLALVVGGEALRKTAMVRCWCGPGSAARDRQPGRLGC